MNDPNPSGGDAARDPEPLPGSGAVQQHHNKAADSDPQNQYSAHQSRHWIGRFCEWTKREWTRTDFHQQVNIILTFVLVLATIVYVVFSGLTLRAIRISAETAGHQTDKLIAAAEIQSRAAKEMTTAVKDQAKFAGEFAGSADSINQQTKLAVDRFGRMAKASEDNIKAIRDSSRSDQRAWVGVVAFNAPKPAFEVGNQPVLSVTISNTGKTPALRCKSLFAAKSYPVTQPFVANYGATTGRNSIDTIPPNARPELQTPPLAALTGYQIDSIKNGTLILYIFGKITYEDVFGITHQSQFCYALSHNLTSAEGCETYNDAN